MTLFNNKKIRAFTITLILMIGLVVTYSANDLPYDDEDPGWVTGSAEHHISR